MWEKLEQIARRCAEIGELLTVPEIYGDAKELRRLTQEQKELEPVAQCYEDYRRAERTIAEATELLSDAELRDMAQEELRQAKADKERLYEELRVLLLPRDPNDGKNVIMELRGGVGGEESALFARRPLPDVLHVRRHARLEDRASELQRDGAGRRQGS